MTDTITLTLYLHDEREASLLLSPYGRKRDASWVPRSLVVEPMTMKSAKPRGEQCHEGEFVLPMWKAKELGWVDAGDAEGQGRMEL